MSDCVQPDRPRRPNSPRWLARLLVTLTALVAPGTLGLVAGLLGVIAGATAPAFAQAPAPAAASFWTVDQTFGGTALLLDRMATNNYQVFGVTRTGPAPVEHHALDADIILVLDGAATFVTGGTVIDGKERAPNERTGTGISGGDTWPLTSGDIIVVPNGVPHWFRDVRGAIRYVAVKIRQAAAQPSAPAAVRFLKGTDAFTKGGLVFDATEGRFARIYALALRQPLAVELHGLDTDVVFVRSGTGTFITGGTISEPRVLREHEGSGTGIVGGVARRLDAGTLLVVPSNVPHWLSAVDGSLEFFAVKVR